MPARRPLLSGFGAVGLVLAFSSPARGADQAWNIPFSQEFEGAGIEWTLSPIPTRGATLNLLVGRPRGEARGAVLLFPGGHGAGMFRERWDGFWLGGNFLVRNAPRFAKEGFLAAVVDAPSDHASGMSDAFRTSPEHLADAEAAAEHLARIGIRDIFLIGTSRGTTSVAYLATRIKHPAVKGFVLSSSMNSISNFPLEEIALPTLVVHHAQDECRATAYSAAQAAYGRLKAPRKHFVTVSGGDTPVSGPCEARSAHGYLGKEREVIGAIVRWLKGEAAPARIDP